MALKVLIQWICRQIIIGMRHNVLGILLCLLSMTCAAIFRADHHMNIIAIVFEGIGMGFGVDRVTIRHSQPPNFLDFQARFYLIFCAPAHLRPWHLAGKFWHDGYFPNRERCRDEPMHDSRYIRRSPRYRKIRTRCNSVM